MYYGYKCIDNRGTIQYIEGKLKEDVLENNIKKENIFTSLQECVDAAHYERQMTIKRQIPNIDRDDPPNKNTNTRKIKG